MSTEGNGARPAAPRGVAAWSHAAAQARCAELALRRSGMELVEELVGAMGTSQPAALLAAACEGFTRVLGAYRVSTWSEDFDGVLRLRRAKVADCLRPAELGRLPSVPALAQLLERRLHDGVESRQGQERLACEVPGQWREVSVLVVPIASDALYLLEADGERRWGDAELTTARIVATLTAQSSRERRRAREEEHHAATAEALRGLLEKGIQASSPIEAARALAGTAAQVLEFPIGCAYLVDDAGLITEVVSVGADALHAERLRAHLVGKLARGSPVWRRTVEGPEAGPDLISDTNALGSVRSGGVAQALDLRAMAAIPLLSSDGPLGLVLCGDSAPRWRWRVGDRALLAQLALEGAVVVDNARLRQAERYEATHDALTALPNRRAFSERLTAALARSGATPVAVLLLDLDRFKEVNDHLGHHRGDQLLVAVGERLASALAGRGTLSRLGGDEFAVLIDEDGTEHQAARVAEALMGALVDPFEISDALLHVDASIGIACAPAHANDSSSLLQRADAAMYYAKREGLGAATYGPAVAAEAAADLGLLAELRRALADGRELTLHYQPKVDLRNGALCAVEALVRWQHPRHGLLLPDRFVPLAEESGLIRALTNWVVPEALRQAQAWRDQGLDLAVAVNVSARDIGDPGFSGRVEGWLDTPAGARGRLVIEVTEGAVMADRHVAVGALQQLRELGCRVSLDDFGTGYSSLAYLEALPVDELKIDRGFLQLAGSRRSLVRSMIELGHELEMRVVAEGVESEEHARWLAELGCDEAQGFHFSAALPPDEILDWARSAPSA